MCKVLPTFLPALLVIVRVESELLTFFKTNCLILFFDFLSFCIDRKKNKRTFLFFFTTLIACVIRKVPKFLIEFIRKTNDMVFARNRKQVSSFSPLILSGCVYFQLPYSKKNIICSGCNAAMRPKWTERTIFH